MSQTEFKVGRRSAIKVLAGSAVLGVFSVYSRQVLAESTHKVSPDNAAAKSLHFVFDATGTDRPAKQGVPGDQQFCKNCQFLQPGEGEWRACTIFGEKLVNVNGWCSGWTRAS